MDNELVGVAAGAESRGATPGMFWKGECDRSQSPSCASIAFARGLALPKHFGRFLWADRTPSDSEAQYPGARGMKPVRLLTSQRSQPFSGTGRNRQTGNDAASPRYGRLEDEADHCGAVALTFRVAEVREVSLLGLSRGEKR